MIFMGVLFIALELAVYRDVTMVIFEIPRTWLAYYSYMTLKMCPIYTYMLCLFLGAVFNVLTYLSVLLSFSIISIILFPCQLFLMVYCSYITWIKI